MWPTLVLMFLLICFVGGSTVQDCPGGIPRIENGTCAPTTSSPLIYALNFKMRSNTVWMLANRPNYITNIDKRFPYSEVPYLGEYDLVKIPASLSDLIEHVDYWGEGKVVSEEGIRGFSNCYNVNHQYQLVSSGPDLGSKIPNRIPVLSYTNCDTSGYIRDDSVLTVTIVGANITSSCAKDIARIVNRDHGMVVVYGVQDDSQEISELAVELRKKGLTCRPGAILPRELQGLTYYDNHVAFINTHSLKEEWYNNVVNGNYDAAVKIAQNVGGEFITEIVMRLISSAPRNVMSLAYKLWHGGAKDIVCNYFPQSFQHIFNEDPVTIVNKQYQQPLKLDMQTGSHYDRLAWGDNDQCQITSERFSWKVLPVWDSDGVTFKLYNTHRSMYLKLKVNVDHIGDRQVWGSTNSDEVRHRYYLEPLVKNGTLVFFIINCKYDQELKMSMYTDNIGDRQVWGHKGNVHNENERFMWAIEAWHDSHMVFLNTHCLKEEWYNNVVNGNYDAAVEMTQNFGTTGGEFINEIVTRLISSAPRNVMSLSYKLWHGGAKDIVCNYFPSSFQHIFNNDAVTIVNKQYQQPLKLDVNTDSYNDRLVWGDNNQCQITSERLSWKILPVWIHCGVTFKLYNTHCNMYLKLDVNVDLSGDRQVWGSPNSDEVRHRYYLEPLVKNGTLVFFIINCKYDQELKMSMYTDDIGDRRVWGHKGTVHNESERFRWVIAAW